MIYGFGKYLATMGSIDPRLLLGQIGVEPFSLLVVKTPVELRDVRLWTIGGSVSASRRFTFCGSRPCLPRIETLSMCSFCLKGTEQVDVQ